MRYRIRLRKYWNLDDFSHSEHYVSAQISKFLPTRTTLRGDVSFGYKDYRDPGRDAFGYGNQRVVGPVESKVPNEGQVVLAFQIAQSLSNNTGLSFRYQARLNPTTDRYYLTGEESGYGEDDDLFNDRYDYEGHKWTARLTQRFRKGLRVVIAAGYETQDYDGRPALDLLGESVFLGAWRGDRIIFASISVEKPLTQLITAGVWYGLERNRSNDVYYNYSGRHSLSIGFDIQF